MARSRRSDAGATALRFGTAGVPKRSRPGTLHGIACSRDLGLGCMEMAWVNGVRMRDETADAIASAAHNASIELTVHAPYFINLCGSREIAARSEARLLHAARLAYRCGARSMCFHAGFYGTQSPARASARIRQRLERISARLRSEGISVWLRPELTGKPVQAGAFEELLEWCDGLEHVEPCIDFAHHCARTQGQGNGYDAFTDMLDALAARLGPEALARVHVHLSGIEYGARGERRHLPLRRSAFRYREALQALADRKASGWVICESPEQEVDALHLARLYRRMTSCR